MAEEEEQQKPGFISRLINVNIFKRGLRRLKFPVKYRGYPKPTYTQLNREIGFSNLQALARLLVETEINWEGKAGEENPNSHSALAIRKNIVELYSKDDQIFEEDAIHEHISISLGPFTSLESTNIEGNAAENGSGVKEEKIKIKVNMGNGELEEVEGSFSVPKEIEIKWPELINENGEYKNRSYHVDFFGHENKTYWENLGLEISKICENVKRKLLDIYGEESEKISNIEKNLDLIKSKVRNMYEAFQNEIIPFESSHRSAVKGGVGVNKLFDKYEDLKKLIRERNLTEQQVRYHHTYFVVGKKEIIRKHSSETGEEVEFGYKLEKLKTFWKKQGEVEVGFDEHGWPLEVANEPYRFMFRYKRNGEIVGRWETFAEGSVLLDIFELEEDLKNGGRLDKSKVRIVPKEFRQELDLLEMACLIDNHYDSYRDDLRDGRYCSESITVMEHIIASLKAKDVKKTRLQKLSRWFKSMKETKEREAENPEEPSLRKIKEGIPAVPKLKSNRDGIGELAAPFVPTHLNPAFDLRHYGEKKAEQSSIETIHEGRKLYYEMQENNALAVKPMITTRGAAMYILHRVINETKYWNEVEELCERIGSQIGGYDIGPNTKLFGRERPTNPFRL